MCKYFFSVIVSVYNADEYLKTCLDSIMCQTFRDYEVIIIDDGSTDRSAAICDDYGNRPNVTVIHQENHRIAQTRQLGLERAQGEYVIFMDADDWVDENHLEVRHDCLKASGTELLWSAYHNHKQESSYTAPPSKYKSSTSAEIIIARYHNRITAFVWEKTYLRSFLECNKIHFGQYSHGEDNFFNIQVFYYAHHIAFDDHATYHYRYNLKSMSYNKTKESKIKAFTDVLGNLSEENNLFHFSANKDLCSSFYYRVNDVKRWIVRYFYKEPTVLAGFLDVLPESFRFLKVRNMKDLGLYIACRYRCYFFYQIRGWLLTTTKLLNK